MSVAGPVAQFNGFAQAAQPGKLRAPLERAARSERRVLAAIPIGDLDRAEPRAVGRVFEESEAVHDEFRFDRIFFIRDRDDPVSELGEFRHSDRDARDPWRPNRSFAQAIEIPMATAALHDFAARVGHDERESQIQSERESTFELTVERDVEIFVKALRELAFARLLLIDDFHDPRLIEQMRLARFRFDDRGARTR